MPGISPTVLWSAWSKVAQVEVASLPADAPLAWEDQFHRWEMELGSRWAVCGVHPARRERLVDWVQERCPEV